MRKKLFLMISMLLSLTVYSEWNESEYRQYILSRLVDLEVRDNEMESSLLHFPKQITLFVRKGGSTIVSIPGMFNWRTDSSSCGLGIDLGMVTEGKNGVRLDVRPSCDVRSIDFDGAKFFFPKNNGDLTTPINVTIQVDEPFNGNPQFIDLFWNVITSSVGESIYQRIVLVAPLSLEALDLDLGLHSLNSNYSIEGSTRIYVNGSPFLGAELSLEEANIELVNENYQIANVHLDLDGSDSVSVYLGAGGEAAVNLNARVTNRLQEVGAYRGEVRVTAKYI